MTRFLVLPFTLLLVACGVDRINPVVDSGSDADADTDVDSDTDADADTDSDSDGDGDSDSDSDSDNGGYTFGGTGDTADGVEDTAAEDTAESEDTGDTAAEDTGTDVAITAWIVVEPRAEWEASLSTSGAPTTCMFKVANVTTGDWTDYGDTAKCTDTGTGDEALTGEVTFIPGEVLSVNVSWFDGYSNKYLAEHGNVVNSDAALFIYYSDGTSDMYAIDSTGTMTSAGNAYYYESSWVGDDGNTYTSQDVRVATH